MILNQMSSFICPLLKNISVKKSYGLIIILTVLYEFSLPLYFVDVQTFLMTDVFLEFLFATAVSNYVINYNAFIMERYNTDIFKDVQYYKNMICSIATIIGFTIVSVMDLLFKTYEITIICFMVMIFISICVEIYNYKAYWTDI